MSFDSRAVLKEYGVCADADVDIFKAAMAFAAAAHPGIDTGRYFHHMKKLTRDCAARFDELIAAGALDDAGGRVAALKHILHDRENYIGDMDAYDDLENADIIRVIDRRKGMPIALAILYIHAGRACGWAVQGLNFPGHFLCRMDMGAERIIFDPFAGCLPMDAPDLRFLIKRVRGPGAEISADYYAPCSNRDMLIRLQNNVKLRLIAAEDYAGALESVEMMRLLDPGEMRLLFDAGVLYVKTGQDLLAEEILETYLASGPAARDRMDAETILREIRARE